MKRMKPAMLEGSLGDNLVHQLVINLPFAHLIALLSREQYLGSAQTPMLEMDKEKSLKIWSGSDKRRGKGSIFLFASSPFFFLPLFCLLILYSVLE